MHLPRVVVAALAARQLDGIIPSDYCQPQCPSCKENVATFDSATSCVADSPFITNCGACQKCIITYSIDHPVPNLGVLESDLQNFINKCDNTSISSQVSALQSQASRLSVLASSVAVSATTTGTANVIITTAPTPTGSSDARLCSILGTASWSSQYAAGQSSRSASFDPCASSPAAAVASEPTGNAASITATSSTNPTTTPQPGPGPALNSTWIVGPIVGSILGLATVVLVIYCTKRKHRKEEWELGTAMPKELPKEDDEESNDSQGKPQLHSECVPRKEMDSTEVAPPVELPALEPVGMELLTPRDETERPEKEWPLPISPLPALFAMTEIRDERTGTAESPKHETFYHP